MTNSPAHHGSQGMIPGDEQMDQLLREFFRNEIPAELEAGPFATATLVAEDARPNHAAPAVQSPGLTIVAQDRSTKSPAGSRGMMTAAVMTSIAACLLAAVALLPGRSDNGQSNQNATAVVPEEESTMPVSSEGQTNSHPVGDNNLTIEEVDSIEIKTAPNTAPQK